MPKPPEVGAPEAKLVGGVWLPDGEHHLTKMLLATKAKHKAVVVDGRHTYQYRKLRAAMAYQSKERRRVCLDIGAHVGLWAMWLVREFAHVHCFEPVPKHIAILPHNMQQQNWTLHDWALGDREDTVAFHVPVQTTGNGHVATVETHPGTRGVSRADLRDVYDGIRMRTLDSLGLKNVDFIKIDVEGYERRVLVGAEQTVRVWRPNIVVEQKGNESAYGEAPDAAKALLESWGMKALKVISGDWIMGW